jgi:predicted nucleic acid-binding protein
VYTLDTNTIIYYLDRDEKVNAKLRKIFDNNKTVYASTITEIEVLSFPRLSEDEEREIESMLKTILLIPVDSQVARIAAEVRRMYGLKTPDSAIAATALFTQTTLLTRNVRDFKKIPQLEVEEV